MTAAAANCAQRTMLDIIIYCITARRRLLMLADVQVTCWAHTERGSEERKKSSLYGARYTCALIGGSGWAAG